MWRIPASEVERLTTIAMESNKPIGYSLRPIVSPGGIRAHWDSKLDAKLDAMNAAAEDESNNFNGCEDLGGSQGAKVGGPPKDGG